MKFIFAAIFAVLGASAHAATVIEVSGPDEGNGPIVGQSDPGAGVEFSLTSSITNASFSLDFYCATSSCVGDLYLTSTGLGVTPGILDAATPFSTGSGYSTLTAFSGLNMGIGDWAVLLVLDDNVDQWGVWLGSIASAVETGDGSGSAGATKNIDGNNFDSNFPIESVFETHAHTAYWKLEADAGVPAVPLPSSGAIFAGGLLGLFVLRRRKGRRA